MNADEKAEIQSRIENLDEPEAGLKDWTAIRVHLKKHDDEMIGDYEDDINTMLVFAGLFSAVVTAFIIDSYKWLQQDSTQIMIRLLVQISSQLPTPQPLASFISTSSTSLGSDSADFRPTMSSVWINVLCMVVPAGQKSILHRLWSCNGVLSRATARDRALSRAMARDSTRDSQNRAKIARDRALWRAIARCPLFSSWT